MPLIPPRARALTVAALLVTATACGQERPGPAAPAAPAAAPGPIDPSATTDPSDPGPTAAPAHAPAEVPSDGVIARAGEMAITTAAVRALVAPRVAAGEVPPSAEAVRAAIHELAMTRSLAAAARAERFEPPAELDASDDAALAGAFLDARAAGEVDTEVDAADLAAFLVERRRATALVLDEREPASQLQATLLEAIANAPERAAEIFADFRARHPLTAELTGPPPDLAFDLEGRAAAGHAIAHPTLAMAAFALPPREGVVSPPVQLGPNRWALVQLLEIAPARAVSDLSEAQLAAAREGIVASRVAILRGIVAARTLEASPVVLVEREVEALAAALTAGAAPSTTPGGVVDGPELMGMKRLRMERLRRLPADRLPEAVRGAHPRLRGPRDNAAEARNPVDDKRVRRAPPASGEATP